MPITVKTKSLLESRDALKELSDIPIPIRTALKLRRIYRAVTGDFETTQELMKQLGEKHAKKDEAGNPIHPTIRVGDSDVIDESRVEIIDGKAYSEQLDELLNTDIVIAFDPIKVDDLVDPKDQQQKVKTSLVFALDWLIEG